MIDTRKLKLFDALAITFADAFFFSEIIVDFHVAMHKSLLSVYGFSGFYLFGVHVHVHDHASVIMVFLLESLG